MIRIGQGFDVHKFANERDLIIGGVKIPFEKGLLGHSDADVLLHALADAILGAIGEGDIGKWFPDDNQKYEGIDSKEIIRFIWKHAKDKGFMVENVDLTIIAEKPKMAKYIPSMQTQIAMLLDCGVDQVNVKATTTEKMGFVGRGEGIAALAVVLLAKGNL